MDIDKEQNRGGRPRTRRGAIRTGITYWRTERGMTQTAVALAAEVPQGRLSSWEGGYALPTLAELERVAAVLNVTPAHLYSDDMLRELRATPEVA